MMSISDKGIPAPCPSPFNIAAYVLSHAERLADKCALEVLAKTDGQSFTYKELSVATLRMGAALRAQGCQPGDRIIMRLGNTVSFPLVFLGAIAAGLIPVPLSSQLTAVEVGKIVLEIRPVAIIHSAFLDLPQTNVPVHDAQDLLEMRDIEPITPMMGDPNRLAYIVYTSGTSGKPRAVMHAHRVIWARRMMWQGWYDLCEDDRMLHAGAFNWTYTLGTGLMDPWTIGATALITADGTPASELPDLIAKHDVTLFAAAPGVYRRLLNTDKTINAPKLRHGLSAGEKLSPRIADRWEKQTGTLVHEAMGMSECSTFLSGSPHQHAVKTSLGFAQPGRRIAVVDIKGDLQPVDTEGILAISMRDTGMMLGYFEQPQETASRIKGEWFLTGDTVSMNCDGMFTFLGRDDDMMNAGGVRVSPIEVEDAFSSHPNIISCAAVEVPVKEDVNVIALYYNALTNITDAEFQAFAEKRLATYKRPRLYQRKEDLPINANGKINRRALRQSFRGPHGQA
ncbi:MAG: class I adenylate-forming enzyme family protein [Paracoccaceae bacterium]|nr:class I adenylate-forming enzyme family protein [Paracoccaceae bacterium]